MRCQRSHTGLSYTARMFVREKSIVRGQGLPRAAAHNTEEAGRVSVGWY